MRTSRASWLLAAAIFLVVPHIANAQSDTTQKVLGNFSGVQLVGKRTGYSLGFDCVLIGYRNQTTDKVTVDFTIWARQKSGAEGSKKGWIELKPGEFKGGGTFFGDDMDLDLCLFDSPIATWKIDNIKVTNLSVQERAEEAKRQEEERQQAALREAEQQRIRAEEAQRQAEAEAAKKAEEDKRVAQERQRQRDRDKATRAEQGKQIQQTASDLMNLDVGEGAMRGEFGFGGGVALFEGDTKLGDQSAAGIALNATLRQLIRLGSSMKLEIGGRAEWMFGSTAYMLYQADLNANTNVSGTKGTEGLVYDIAQIQPTARIWFGSFGVGVLADWRQYSVSSEDTGEEIKESQLAFAPVASISSNQRSGNYMLSAFMVPAGENTAGLLGISGEIMLGGLRLSAAYVTRSDGVNDISKDSQIVAGLGLRMPW